MSDRVPISPKLRFEVFKRDKFTCQYCGAKAPDVVLECDHIQPVADGGTNDILNLVTSCKSCNGGKGARKLSDTAVLDKQRDMLAELEERRQQIEMMLDWRRGLQEVSDGATEAVAQRMLEKSGFGPNETGRQKIRGWLKKFDLAEVLEAIDDAFDAYGRYVDDEMTDESWNLAVSKVQTFASVIRQEKDKPGIRRLLYIQGVIRGKTGIKHYDCIAYLEHLHACGISLDELERSAKRMPFKRAVPEDFEKPYDEWLASIGQPF